MDFQLLYVNCTSKEEAQKIGKRLVEEKWVASASILNQTLSYYWWEGEMREDPQTTLIMQCRTQHVDQISNVIKSMHAYSLPCIISMEIKSGDEQFIDWMQRVLPAHLPLEASDGE